jgi:anaerobic dimethyl sulfoxide reductase subunit A
MMTEDRAAERVVMTGCSHDCGGCCVLKVHLRDGAIAKIETDDGEEPQVRACLRGRAYRQRVYSPERLTFPMKRVGTRGEGKFERISWDEALDTVASELRRVKEAYGPASILSILYGGSASPLNGGVTVSRLLNKFGGCTNVWGSASCGGLFYGSRITYGTIFTANTRDDLVNSRLIVMWGWNPANTILSTNTSYYLAKANESGAKIVCIDPRFTDTAASFADDWIPIVPGTDTAMMVAMAYVIVQEHLQDQRFLDTYTVGFDRFREYVLGLEDGVPKTPAWAEAITGVSAAAIENLARQYATIKPAALMTGYAPGRTAYGEQYHRVSATLAAMTANIGIHGGNAAGFELGTLGSIFDYGLPTGENPLGQGTEEQWPFSPTFPAPPSPVQSKVPLHKVWDAILRGKAGGYYSDFKLLYVACSNPVNQFLNVNKCIEALRRLEFIIVHEQFMTSTARFADILLPVNTSFERNDIARPWLWGPYCIYMNKAIDSLYESKSDFEICAELAPRLGVADYSDKTEDEWLREIVNTSFFMVIPDYGAFKKKGVHKVELHEPEISFKKQIEDPANNPFPTHSGKIEIFSQRLADLNVPNLPPIPKYIETWEGRNDCLANKYPLQLITAHCKRRVHSQLDNIPWLKELEPQTVWINSSDAQIRGVGDGGLVRVFNDRGAVIIPAKVTERIMPGVVSITEGAWYRPDEAGVDWGGCANVLTRDESSPGGAFPSNSSLVQVEKA